MMKNLMLTSILLSQLTLPAPVLADDEEPNVSVNEVVTNKGPAGMAEEKPILSQPGPANDMLFERLHTEKKIEEKYPVIDLRIAEIEQGKSIPAKFAYCAPDGNGKTINGG